MNEKHSNRIGEVFTNKEGYKFKIVKYNKNSDLVVEFMDEYRARVHTKYQSCQNGSVKNPYHISVYGVGCLGLLPDGSKPLVSIEGKKTREYAAWTSILSRCYNKKDKAYKWYGEKGVYVEDRWLVFANFYQDIKDLPGYDIWKQNSELCAFDKDMKSKDNEIKCYSRETVTLTTNRENCKEMAIRNKAKKIMLIDKDNNKVIIFKTQKQLGSYLGIGKSTTSVLVTQGYTKDGKILKVIK